MLNVNPIKELKVQTSKKTILVAPSSITIAKPHYQGVYTKFFMKQSLALKEPLLKGDTFWMLY